MLCVCAYFKFAKKIKKNYQDFFSGLNPAAAGVSIYVIRLDIIFLVGCMMVEYLKLHARNFNFFLTIYVAKIFIFNF